MVRPRLCGVITSGGEVAIGVSSGLVDMFELRLDLIGPAWIEVAKSLTKPWIATNRLPEEGGRWVGTEEERIAELRRAAQTGAVAVDIELATPGLEMVAVDLKRWTQLLISYHNLENTPPLERVKEIVAAQLKAGADICKVATTACCFDDNIVILELIRSFPGSKVVAMAMGEAGRISRVIGPLVGGDFTYCALDEGAALAPGQYSAAQMARLFGVLGL